MQHGKLHGQYGAISYFSAPAKDGNLALNEETHV